MMHTVILACTTLLEAVKTAQAVCKTTFPVIELDRQYHVEPEPDAGTYFADAFRAAG